MFIVFKYFLYIDFNFNPSHPRTLLRSPDVNLKDSAHSADPREKARTMWKCFLGSDRVCFVAEVHGHESALDTSLGLVRHSPGIFQRPLGDHDSIRISTLHLLRKAAATEDTNSTKQSKSACRSAAECGL